MGFYDIWSPVKTNYDIGFGLIQVRWVTKEPEPSSEPGSVSEGDHSCWRYLLPRTPNHLQHCSFYLLFYTIIC